LTGVLVDTIDIYAADGTSIARLYDGDVITATPAVTASHPSIVARAYGATASGKVSVYAPPEDENEDDDVKKEVKEE
jgi:hypothetical protein